MKRVMLIADDFGMSTEINAAVRAAHEAGTIAGAALMVDQDFTGDAVQVAKANPGLAVGLHLNFTDLRRVELGSPWRPFPWQTHPALAHVEAALPWNAAGFRRETRWQFEAFLATGLRLAFINGHHHLHVQPVVFAEIERCLDDLIPTFNGWIRLGACEVFEIPGIVNRGASAALPNPRWAGAQTHRVHLARTVGETRVEDVLHVLENSPGCTEIILHPGADKRRNQPRQFGDDGHNRQPDAALLIDPRVREAVRAFT